MGRRADIKPLPSLERLNERFVYEPLTGDLRWKSIPANFKRANVGDIAGTVGKKGHCVITIDRVIYLKHRIIWKMVTGFDPVDMIDHKDTDRQNNRWSNLREATNGPNIQNSRLRKDNRSGVKGVCWDEVRKVWTAGINSKRIGRFKDKQDAINARMTAAAKMHGEFMRVA